MMDKACMKLDWKDAAIETPPDESLLLVIEDRDSKGRVADMVAGFFAEGEYHVGTTMAGDPLPADQVVRYWAIPIWPQGYDEIGIWQGPSEEATGSAICMGCGCDDLHACWDDTAGNPCSWLVVDRAAGLGVCSCCPDHMERWRQGDHTVAVPVEPAAVQNRGVDR